MVLRLSTTNFPTTRSCSISLELCFSATSIFSTTRSCSITHLVSWWQSGIAHQNLRFPAINTACIACVLSQTDFFSFSCNSKWSYSFNVFVHVFFSVACSGESYTKQQQRCIMYTQRTNTLLKLNYTTPCNYYTTLCKCISIGTFCMFFLFGFAFFFKNANRQAVLG